VIPKISSSEDDLLNVFLPILDDEEQRRLQDIEMEEKETDWDLLIDDDSDEETEDCKHDY